MKVKVSFTILDNFGVTREIGYSRLLKPFQGQLKGIVVESTFNWYWLIDGLMDAGYHCVHLANPSTMKQYGGIKHTDDQHDAFFLAQMLILGILP